MSAADSSSAALGRAAQMKAYLQQKYSKITDEDKEKADRRRTLEEKLSTMSLAE